MKALYFPYTSPTSYETVLRSLLLYEQIGAITPSNFFVANRAGPEQLLPPLARAMTECEKYSADPLIFTLDPVQLIAASSDLFAESVISDMKNPVFKANAPTGRMMVYADKMNRRVFETFRRQIKANGVSNGATNYKEGPYSGAEHFLWEVTEPLAHSILLNLTLLGVNKTNSVPITDSRPSQRAFLYKTSGASKQNEAHVAASDLLQLALPSRKDLEIRRILDFRDGHKKELSKFWSALEEEQTKLENQFNSGSNQLYTEARIEFDNLKNAIASADQSLKWTLPTAVGLLGLGLAGHSLSDVAGSSLASATAIAQELTARSKARTHGLSYLLQVEDEFKKQ